MFFVSKSAAVDDIRREVKQPTLKRFARVSIQCVDDLDLFLAVKIPDEGMRRSIISQLWQRFESRGAA